VSGHFGYIGGRRKRSKIHSEGYLMPFHQPAPLRTCGLLILGLVLATTARSEARGEDRTDLTIAKSIVGHWRSHSGKSEYYFATDGSLVMSEENGAKQQAQTYEVVKSDEDEEVLHLKVKVVATGGGHEKELRFASDRKSLMSTIRSTINGRTYVINVTWHYVDDAQHPPKQGNPEKG